MFQERRKKFLINKPLQFRYMGIISGTLLLVAGLVMASLYFGIWGGILDAFSNDQIRERLVTATRMVEYESARTPQPEQAPSLLSLFRQSEKLSERQREVFRDILDETNKKLVLKLFLLLLLIAWGSIYISHKVAGPLYRIFANLAEVKEGNLKSRMHLRKGDEGQFIADEFNASIEKMDASFSTLKEILKSQENNSKDSSPELRNLIGQIEAELVKYRTSADG